MLIPRLMMIVVLGGGVLLPGGRAAGAETASATASPAAGLVTWRVVSEVPLLDGQTSAGLAGVFAGALNATHALMAGGTYYEGKGPLDGGQRTFSDALLILEQSPGAAGAPPSYAWSTPEMTLPSPLAYGASVTLDDGVLLIGGMDGNECVADVRLATWDRAEERLKMVDFPPLPKPLAYAGAGRVGSWVMVVGGATTPDGDGGDDVFGLDLAGRAEGAEWAWQTLPALPVLVQLPIVVGEEGEDGRALHVFGGRDQRPQARGRVMAEGWRFDPVTQQWSSSGPIKLAGAAGTVRVMGGTAVALEDRRLLLLGGDDGVLANVLEENSRRGGLEEERAAYAKLTAAMLAAHPGHRREQLLYDVRRGVWRAVGSFPAATPAVTPAFVWDGAIMLMGGEPAPGRRSAAVWLGAMEAE